MYKTINPGHIFVMYRDDPVTPPVLDKKKRIGINKYKEKTSIKSIFIVLVLIKLLRLLYKVISKLVSGRVNMERKISMSFGSMYLAAGIDLVPKNKGITVLTTKSTCSL